MDAKLLAALHQEERQILAQLRASLHFRRLEEIRQLLRLYDEAPPIGAALDAVLGAAPARPAPPPAAIPLRAERARA
jgi:hypothetical protein